MEGTPVGSSARDRADGAPPAPGARDGIRALRAGDRVGEYVLEEPIGQGGCGTVWRARHAVLPGVTVAVKLPRDPELIELLRRESLLQHGLDHPGILKVLGVDLDAEVPYVVQEYAAGGDLAALLGRRGRLPPREALALFRDIAEIVAHAHAHGVVHGDLKPQNILLDARGRVRIADFGLGRSVEALTASALQESIESLGPRTDTRHLGGTWEYMAPELRGAERKDAGDGAFEPSGDVYALGIVFHEMLRGERPAGRVDLEDISPDYDRLFAGCWTSRERRYRNAGELLRDVRKVEKGKQLGTPGSRARRLSLDTLEVVPERRPSRFRRFFWGHFVPLGLVAGALAFLWVNEDRKLPGPVDVAAPPAVAPRDEADELAAIRRGIEDQPTSIEEAAGILRAFRARASDPRLADLARRWEEAVLSIGEGPHEFRVRWKRFAISGAGYRKEFHARLEPGYPDVYLRVFRTRSAEEELVFDSSDEPVEAWSRDWTREPEWPSFTLEWMPGDELRIEMRESDILADDTIADYRLGGDLSILLVSSPRRDENGHLVELETSFGFGK